MNLYQMLTLNKYGDVQEVLFSSTLSYLLNPKMDHGIGTLFLQKLLEEIYPEVGEEELSGIEVTSEYPFGKDVGTVDLFIQKINSKVLAIEVKIWDKSAQTAESEESQLKRYCKHLSKHYNDEDWNLIFLVPSIQSKICLKEFKCVQEIYGEKVKLMSWNLFDLIDDASENKLNGLINKSIADLLAEINSEKLNLNPNEQWVLDSLIEYIPNFIEKVKDEQKFPSLDDLKALNTWPIFEEFHKMFKRPVSTMHTTIGIPYGEKDNKVKKVHGNCLFRIRTTKSYYYLIEDKTKNLPSDNVEIEIWPDVYKSCKTEFHQWATEVGTQLIEGFHLNEKGKEQMHIISLERPIGEDNIKRFTNICRKGFKKCMGETVF